MTFLRSGTLYKRYTNQCAANFLPAFISSVRPPPAMEVNINNTFGAIFIGGMVAAVMYGITTLQTYLYYVYYPTDSKSIKYLVALIWVLDTLHVCFMCHCLYYYFVSNFGDQAALNTATWSLTGSFFLNLCTTVLVQTYFSFRISHLTRSSIRWWLTCSIMVLVIAHFAFGLETAVLSFKNTEFGALQQVTISAIVPFGITAVLSDVCIATALCVLLHGIRSPVIETNVLVNTLIVYAINRCLLTAIVTVTEVIVFTISPNSTWFVALDFVMGKLYANSFLASLNSRNSLRRHDFQVHSRSDGMSVRFNAINLPSIECDSNAGVKTFPDNDLGLLEMDNLRRGMA